jgi:hypothetical protein
LHFGLVGYIKCETAFLFLSISIDLLVLTSLDQLLLIIFIGTKSQFNKGVKCIGPSPSVSFPWFITKKVTNGRKLFLSWYYLEQFGCTVSSHIPKSAKMFKSKLILFFSFE